MRLRALVAMAALALAAGLAGCGHLPGEVAAQGTAQRPDQVTDFHALYNVNCRACHGENGQNGPAMDLANPEFQALVDDNTLRKIITNGLPGTQMPAWAQSAGGMLTDEQIDAIIAGMRREWAKPDAFAGATPPPFAQDQAGNSQHGQQVYQARCASCHQQPARQQITSSVYLSLVSDQAIRSIIIAGRPDIGQPDWRLGPAGTAAAQHTAASTPLAPQDVTDIVTYLHTLRNPAAVSAALTTTGPTPAQPGR
ncbi:MAG: c-type cytochrome [Acidobacteriaceae bacterium]